MRTLKIALLLFVVSMLSITCKKEHIQPGTNGSPVFYFSGTVNGSPVSLNAGVNNYYMYSSDSQSAAGVYSFIGNLKLVSPSNNSSIKFIINDYRRLSAGAYETNITTSLDTGGYNYYTLGGIPRDSVIFRPSWGTLAPKSYTYNFGDGNTLSGLGKPPLCSHVYSHLGNYNTSLSIQFIDIVTDSLSNLLKLSTPTTLFTDSITKTDTGSGATVTFRGWGINGSGTYSYLWNFDDSTSVVDTSTSQNPTHTFKDTTRIHNVSLTITDLGNGNTIVSNINTGSSSSTRQHLVDYFIPDIYSVPNTSGLSNITIVYTDPSGKEYTTADSAQKAGSNFQIVSVSPYQNNENNQTTKMLHIKFNCILYNKSGGSIAIKNGDAVIAVAYK